MTTDKSSEFKPIDAFDRAAIEACFAEYGHAQGTPMSRMFLRGALWAVARAALPQQAQEALTEAYAEGRGDQFEDDCAIVRDLFDELNDVDVLKDGFINTTRVREVLSHFDVPAPVECSGLGCTRAECSALGCLADRINTEREKAIDAAIAKGEQSHG